MRSFLCLVPLLLIAACAEAPPPPPAVVTTTSAAIVTVDCGPDLPGFEKIAAAPLVVLGELHGQVGPPAFAANLACREARQSPSAGATLALEIPEGEQTGIDAFLQSDGGEQAKAKLLGGAFWQRATQDGRSSVAMVGLLEKVRGWKSAGLPLRVVAIANSHADRQQDEEQRIAGEVVGLVKQKRGPVVVLIGNLHARTAGASREAGVPFMASYVKQEVPDLVSLDERYGAGDGWMCFGRDPNECGKKDIGGPGSGPVGAIDVFATVDEHGFNGTYSVGRAEASLPARGATNQQEIASMIAKFRHENRPRNENGTGDSILSQHERADWCARIMPIANANVALDGDAFLRNGACEGALLPSRAHAVVPQVNLKLDVGFFFNRPSLSASYDRETRTLFLPLSATYEPWTDSAAVDHEWLHARHHLNARNGFTLDSALMTYANAFTADEVSVLLCDVIHGSPNAERLARAEREVQSLRRELDILEASTKKGRLKRYGVAGTAFGSTDGVERWVGGKDPKKSLAVLEGVWRDAATALLALQASPPDVVTATRVPLLAGDACDPSR